MSQRQAAKQLGVAPPTLCNHLNGERNPDIGMLAQLIDLIGADPHYILFGREHSTNAYDAIRRFQLSLGNMSDGQLARITQFGESVDTAKGSLTVIKRRGRPKEVIG